MLSSKPTGKARVRAFVMVPAMALALIGLATPAVSAVINEVSAATPVEDLRYKISEKSDSTIRVTERNSDVVVTEKADAADAVPFIRTETAPNFPGGKDKLRAFINKTSPSLKLHTKTVFLTWMPSCSLPSPKTEL